MIAKEFLSFLTRFYCHLRLLQGCAYPTLKKILITKSGACRSSPWANFDRVFGGDEFISEFREQILIVFTDLFNVKVVFFFLIKSTLVKGFYLNFVKKDKFILP